MNAKYDAKSKTITVTFAYDPNKQYPASKSGKTNLAASTGGFTLKVPETVVSISLNATVPVNA